VFARRDFRRQRQACSLGAGGRVATERAHGNTVDDPIDTDRRFDDVGRDVFAVAVSSRSAKSVRSTGISCVSPAISTVTASPSDTAGVVSASVSRRSATRVCKRA
jgi:hypothetical protein